MSKIKDPILLRCSVGFYLTEMHLKIHRDININILLCQFLNGHGYGGFYV